MVTRLRPWHGSLAAVAPTPWEHSYWLVAEIDVCRNKQDLLVRFRVKLLPPNLHTPVELEALHDDNVDLQIMPEQLLVAQMRLMCCSSDAAVAFSRMTRISRGRKRAHHASHQSLCKSRTTLSRTCAGSDFSTSEGAELFCQCDEEPLGAENHG